MAGKSIADEANDAARQSLPATVGPRQTATASWTKRTRDACAQPALSSRAPERFQPIRLRVRGRPMNVCRTRTRTEIADSFEGALPDPAATAPIARSADPREGHLRSPE